MTNDNSLESTLLFPTRVESPRENVAQRFSRMLHDLYPDPSCHFIIALPHGWKIVQVDTARPLDEEQVQTIGLLRRDDPKAEAEIAAILVPEDTNAALWLERFLQDQGYRITDCRRLPHSSSEIGDCLAMVTLKQTDYAARTLAVVDGTRLFLVQCRVARRDYRSLAEDFLIVLQSFSLAHPKDV